MAPIDSPQADGPKAQRPLSRRMTIFALADQARWQLLAEMASGEGRMVNDLARRIGKTPHATSKHLKALRTAGIVRMHNRLHQLVERFRPAPGTREIDFGHCVVRLDE